MRGIAVTLGLALAAGCPGSETTPTGGLRFECEPDGASVYVNEIYAGQARALAAGPLHLAPEAYRVEVALDGYFPYYEEVRVGRRVVTVRVTLRPRPE